MKTPRRRFAARTDPLGEVSFLADLTPRERNALLPFMTSIRASQGQVLTEQGTIGREFFIIVEGTATVSRDGQPIATLGAGDHFGEIALLGHRTPRTATVTAATPMKLQVQTPAEMLVLLDRAPQITRRLLDRLADYHAV